MSHSTHGSIEVICGSMFSGKTEELIRRLKRAKYAKLNIQVFKPEIDNRYDKTAVVSHEGFRIEGVAVRHPRHIEYLLEPGTKIVGIDEVQFFPDEIVEIVEELANRGIRVICAGLDQNFKGEPFGPMPKLLAIAESILKVHAVCVQCGGEASKSYRVTKDEVEVVVGEKDVYEARCRTCFFNS